MSCLATKRRIIHLSKHCREGNGNVHVAVDLACMQAEAGHDVIFASEGGTYVEMLTRSGVRHVLLSQDQKRPLATSRAVLTLAGLCRTQKTEIIHAHMMVGAAIGWAAAKLTGAKLVTTVHNSFDRHSTLMRLGDVIVAVSEAERKHLIERGFKKNRLISIWNAPNRSPREAFGMHEQTIALRQPCILTVCGLHRRKGVADLVEAFAAISAEFPEWHLYIAGNGPDRESLEHQVRALGLSHRIIFLGYVKAAKPLFKQAQIFVLPSYADPGSLTIGEARAAGCAIVATAVGGTPEMLEFGKAGRLVLPASPKQLAAELHKLIANTGDREALRVAASVGSEIFDVARLVSDYDVAYDIAVTGPKSRANSNIIKTAPSTIL